MMKKINSYLIERLKLGKEIATYKPNTYNELRTIISELLKTQGMDANLNVIDTSNITDMHGLFNAYPQFNGDISDWDVRKVENMKDMFNGCTEFNCNISRWKTISLKYMNQMFCMCKSFNQDLNDWNVKNVENMKDAFLYCPKCKKPKWYK